jgi:hypothetical protein
MKRLLSVIVILQIFLVLEGCCCGMLKPLDQKQPKEKKEPSHKIECARF